MSTIGSHDATLAGFGDAFNDSPQIPVQGSGFDEFQRGRQAIKGSAHKALSIGIDIADTKSFIQVAVVSSGIVGGNI